MEKQNNNKGVIALLIVIIVILGTLCVLFATGTISFNSNKGNDNDITDNIDDDNGQTKDDDEENINDVDKVNSYVDTKLSDYVFERYYENSNIVELYINNKKVFFEDNGMNYATSKVIKMNDNVFIVEKSLGSTSLYVVNKDAKVIGVFTVGDSDYYKETKILPTKAYYRDTYRIEGNNIYIQTDLFSNGGAEYILCNSIKKDSDVVVYEEKFEYLGNDKFSAPVTMKTITRKQYMKENNIVCK